jgi:hypothetical protein
MALQIALRTVVFLLGAALVLRTLLSAVITFVLPRGVSDKLVRWVFIRMRKLFILLSRTRNTYESKDRLWALFAPLSLLTLPLVWIVLIITGFAAMFWSAGVSDFGAAVTVSGSSLFTLGFAAPAGHGQLALTLIESAIGLFVVAILIAYLPTIYGAWSRREQLVTMLDTRAGTPPTPLQLFIRYHRLGRLENLPDLWEQWETWFADVEETHTSLAILSLFRSTSAERSWIVAAGCVLDSCSLVLSTLDVPFDAQAAIDIRAGALALRRICRLFRLPFDPDPHYPDLEITVSREEWEDVYRRLEEAGVPVVEDRQKAWENFAGWRVNYDQPLLALAGLALAPPAPWSSDRATRYPYARK